MITLSTSTTDHCQCWKQAAVVQEDRRPSLTAWHHVKAWMKLLSAFTTHTKTISYHHHQITVV